MLRSPTAHLARAVLLALMVSVFPEAVGVPVLRTVHRVPVHKKMLVLPAVELTIAGARHAQTVSNTVLHKATRSRRELSQSSRNLFLTLVTIACGSLSVGLLWRASHGTTAFQRVPEDEARRQGFSSSKERSDVLESNASLLENLRQGKSLSDRDFDNIQVVFKTGSNQAKLQTIYALEFLPGAQNHKRIVEPLGMESADESLRNAWTHTLSQWVYSQNDIELKGVMMHSKNSLVREVGGALNGPH